MNQMRIFLILMIILLIGACAPISPAKKKYAIVYGESFATTAEAVQLAQNAVDSAARWGYKPVSVGGGSGSGSGTFELGGGLVINVYILLEGPENAPDILAPTGIAR